MSRDHNPPARYQFTTAARGAILLLLRESERLRQMDAAASLPSSLPVPGSSVATGNGGTARHRAGGAS